MYKLIQLQKTWGVSLTSDKSKVILQEITSAGNYLLNYR
jgi:hypothetical protein